MNTTSTKRGVAVGNGSTTKAACKKCGDFFAIVNPIAMQLYDAGKLHCPACTNRKTIIWSRNSYADYLKTEYWKTRRQRALQKALFACQLCKCTECLDVHHNTYERIGGELDSDLIVLCRECHELFHARIDGLAY